MLAACFTAWYHLADPAQVHAHNGHDNQPVIELEIRIHGGSIELSAYFPVSVLLGEALGNKTVTQWQAMSKKQLGTQLQAYFDKKHPVKIDGVQVRPLFQKIRVDKPDLSLSNLTENDVLEQFGHVDVTLAYETKGQASQVSFYWDTYLPRRDDPLRLAPTPNDSKTTDDVIALLIVDGKSTLIAFSRDEPQYVWHDKGTVKVPASLLVEPKAVPAKLSLPWLSIGLLLATVIGMALLRRQPVGIRFVVPVVLAMLAGICWRQARVEIELPWDQEFVVPPTDESLAIFQTLHKNIYRAFDYLNESEIYDTLAQSVDGPELEAIYNDIYQSLILRDEGGAVCRIDEVTIQSMERSDPPQPKPGTPGLADEKAAANPSSPQDPADPRFHVRCDWIVKGKVRHWGHAHERTNRYEAIYTLAPRGGAWKIIATDILKRARVEEPAPLNLTPGPNGAPDSKGSNPPVEPPAGS